MKKLLLLVFFLFSLSCLWAQFTVRFIVQAPKSENDAIYMAGTFNKWDPGDENMMLANDKSGKKTLSIKLPAGHFEYKFTRGNWTSVEATEAGLDLTNRIINVSSDTTVYAVIEGWMDRFKDFEKLPDSTQWQIAYNRSFFYLERNLDSSYKYAQMANVLAQKLENKKYNAAMERIMGRVMQRQGNHQKALEHYLKQLDAVKQLKDTISISFCLLDIGHLFLGIKDYKQAKIYYRQAAAFDPSIAYAYGHSAPNLALARLGKIYFEMHQLDSARYYALQAYNLSLKIIDRRSHSEALTLLGDILADEGKYNAAIQYYQMAVEQGQLYNNLSLIADNYLHIAKVYFNNKMPDSSFYYGLKAYALAQEIKNPFSIVDAGGLVSLLYKNKGQSDSALKYLEIVDTTKDSLFTQEKNQQLQTILFNEQLQKQEIEATHQKFKAQTKIVALGGGILVLLLLVLILWRNNKRTQKLNSLLHKRGKKIERTFAELKATQSQLIHKEKMASLGELTAGIAHEIQNPLNFINNFSEVSVELAREIIEEVEKLKVTSTSKESLAHLTGDLIKNQEKIKEHGQRADAIVKGMLQHSRKTSGQREAINLNALADEFLRLSYHGLRAKDKSFNAQFKTNFDENIGRVTVVPQNIGRVMLNLFNNAFYSVSEKKKKLNGSFEPMVWVTTQKLLDKIQISVKDNGLGISEDVLNKIFQPFYTTKPSGHGTGLGLSLSYDIITKEHGGTLQVDTKQGEYAEFIVQLPIKE